MEIVYSARAAKNLKKLPKFKRIKIVKKITNLANNPFTGKKLSGEFTGLRSLKIWPYRVIYYYDSNCELLVIVAIRHRQEAYMAVPEQICV